MANQRQRPHVPPPEVAHIVRTLDKWLEKRRRRGVPETGRGLDFPYCDDPNCKGCDMHFQVS